VEKILEINNLRKDYENFSLKDISFSLDRGYIMGFIGQNGAGKSTTIKAIMNLIKKDNGNIKILGLDNIKHEKDIKERIGFVYDENVFYDEFTADETKRTIAPFYKTWNDSLFKKYLKQFDIDSKMKIKKLSKGTQMKLAIAIALAHDAELLIMDEPTSGLDPINRNELMEILSHTIEDERKSVFFSTHITSDLDKRADYITFIDKGEIVFSSAKDDILDEYGIVRGPKELMSKELKEMFVGLRESAYGFEGLVKNRKSIVEHINEKAVIQRPTLEEVMLFSTKEAQNDISNI